MTLLITTNREDVGVTYSKELAEDLMAIHGLDVKTMFKLLYGTKFTIKHDAKTNYFVLETNDIRDGKVNLYLRE